MVFDMNGCPKKGFPLSFFWLGRKAEGVSKRELLSSECGLLR